MTLGQKSTLKRSPMIRKIVPVKPRTRKCCVKTCRQPFIPRSMSHKTCSTSCAMAYVEQEKSSKMRRERQEGLQRLKSRADHAREAQAAVNAVVRFRDRLDGCISCDKPATWNGQWHASHYVSVGACQSIRFDLANIHKSCSICNSHLSGNIRAYRPRLIAKIGLEEVERLEGWHEPRKFTIDELKAIKAHYTEKLKQLKRSNHE